MADIPRQLFNTRAARRPAAATNAIVYTVPTARTAVLSRILICNTHATAAETFRIGVLPAASPGVADVVGNILIHDWFGYDLSCPPADTVNFPVGMGLQAGDSIIAWSSGGNLTFVPAGVEVS